MKRLFNVNGFDIEAEYRDREIREIFLPLLEKMNVKRREKGSRLIVYLAAPPGTGKTTLSLFLEYLYKEQNFPYSFQSISMDGFHHEKVYLLNHWIKVGGTNIPLNNVKGSPESFDLTSLKCKLEELAESSVEWPLYDRNLHDVSKETIVVDSEIVFVEGNWLLLNEEGWKEIKDYSDFSMFIEAPEDLLRSRLIERKMMGGLPRSEAEIFYENSDKKNIFRVLNNRHESSVVLRLTGAGELLHEDINERTR